jgi:DNA polymerase-1
LRRGRESAFLSRELGTIDTAAPVALDLEACRARDFDRIAVEALFRELGFFSLVKKIPGHEMSTTDGALGAKKSDGNLLTKHKDRELFFERCAGAERVAFLMLPRRGRSFRRPRLSVISLLFEKVKRNARGFLLMPKAESCFAEFFVSALPKTTYDAKAAMKILETVGIELRGVDFDCLLAGYLLNAGGSVSLSELSLEYLGETPASDANVGVKALFGLREKACGKNEGNRERTKRR